MSAGFLEIIKSELTSVDALVEKTFKIKPGHLSGFAHLELESLQKYLHPALVLLSGRIFNYTGKKLIYLASVIQFIYLAANIHFAIPDDNEAGKGADPRDGAQLPVLVGDYLYGRYFVGLCKGQILEFLRPLAEVIAEMNYGALLRKKNSGLPVTDEKFVLAVIEKETALLTESAARLSGVLAGAAEAEVSRLADFGRNLGMAYGIIERNRQTHLLSLIQKTPCNSAGSFFPVIIFHSSRSGFFLLLSNKFRHGTAIIFRRRHHMDLLRREEHPNRIAVFRSAREVYRRRQGCQDKAGLYL